MNDTQPQAEAVQIDLLRKATIHKRFALFRTLSESIIQLSKNAIRRANPKLSEQEVNLKFVALHYGEPLAQKVRQYLIK